MKIRLLFCVVLFSLQVAAQTEKLNRLKKELTQCPASKRAVCLNNLSEEFKTNFIQSDSALKYARLAYAAAALAEDRLTKCYSLILQSEIQGQLLGNIDLMEQYAMKALAELKNINAPIQHSQSLLALGLALIWKGNVGSADSVLSIAKTIAEKNNDKPGLGSCYQLIGLNYVKSGQLWKGFKSLKEAQRIAKETGDSLVISMSLALIGRAFNYSNDPEKAVQYYQESMKYKNTALFLLYPHLEDMGYAYLKLNKIDSAVYFQQLYRHNLDSITSDVAVRKRFSIWQMPDFTIDQRIDEKKYDSVLAWVEPSLASQKEKKNLLPLMHSLYNLAQAYEGKKQWKKAVGFGREVVLYAHTSHNKYFLREGHQFLSRVFDQLKQTDSAYFHFIQYTAVKDSMAADQFALRTALYSAESEWDERMAVLNKEKLTRENQLVLKDHELNHQSLLKNILLVSLAVIVLFSFLLFRNILLKRKNDRLTNEQAQIVLKKKALELEMQALRAQMNPHFIFNCLSAIDNLVQTNQADKATAYLSRFAKLIRSVLDSSKQNIVSFQRDFETLRLYLEMEKFRCNNKFNYNLMVDEKLMNGDYKVPPLIIQPFVENAIQHGLLTKEGNDRQLDVSAELVDEQIVYNVTDNGIGRKQAAVFKEINNPRQQSYGIDITRERIMLYNKNGEKDVEIFDLEFAGIAIGTRAIVRINS